MMASLGRSPVHHGDPVPTNASSPNLFGSSLSKASTPSTATSSPTIFDLILLTKLSSHPFEPSGGSPTTLSPSQVAIGHPLLPFELPVELSATLSAAVAISVLASAIPQMPSSPSIGTSLGVSTLPLRSLGLSSLLSPVMTLVWGT